MKVARVHTKGHGGVVDRGAANRPSSVDSTEPQRFLTAGDSQVVPVERAEHG
jgi:hypothetical protein